MSGLAVLTIGCDLPENGKSYSPRVHRIARPCTSRGMRRVVDSGPADGQEWRLPSRLSQRRMGRTMPWLRIVRLERREIGSDERLTAAAFRLELLTAGALFSVSVDLLTHSDSQAISFGSSVHESISVSLLTVNQVFESLMYTKAGVFPPFSH